jgi:hypothetical protein
MSPPMLPPVELKMRCGLPPPLAPLPPPSTPPPPAAAAIAAAAAATAAAEGEGGEPQLLPYCEDKLPPREERRGSAVRLSGVAVNPGSMVAESCWGPGLVTRVGRGGWGAHGGISGAGITAPPVTTLLAPWRAECWGCCGLSLWGMWTWGLLARDTLTSSLFSIFWGRVGRMGGRLAGA